MHRLAVIRVTLQLLEEWQHVGPRPAMCAYCRPLVIVMRRTAIGADAVDRRTPAQQARLLVEPRLCWLIGATVTARCQQRTPQPFLLKIRTPRIWRSQYVRDVGGRDVTAGLAQQHARGGVFAQPRRQRAAGGAASGDQDIEGFRWQVHSGTFPCVTTWQHNKRNMGRHTNERTRNSGGSSTRPAQADAAA